MTGGRARTPCALLLLGVLSCGAPGEDGSASDATTSPLAAVPTTRATLVMEPAVLTIGGVADLEIALVTPPGQRLLPIKVPALQGLWLLENELLPVERGNGRWIHRSRLRVRAREVGSFRWPALSVGIEDVEDLAFGRAAVRLEWAAERTDEVVEAFYREMLDRYEIVIEWPGDARTEEES